MNTAPCNCQTHTSKPSLHERPRYYARQLVTPDDLTLEQNYFRAKLRRHNRYLHGWGVVCGADVVPATKRDLTGTHQQPWKVIVKTGYVLGPYGDEIFIEADQCVDVRKKCGPAETPHDEECLDAQPDSPGADDEPRWIAIRYVESKTRLIRVPLGGCGCEDNACEYSRFADHYEICVIDHCPESHRIPPGPASFPGRGSVDGVGRPAPGCPECENEPWVVLSAFTVDENGNVELRQCDCRRQVVSFGAYWWSCSVEDNGGPPRDDNRVPTTEPAAVDPAAIATPKATPAKPAATKPASTKLGPATPAAPVT
jgi:hypothetical protein